jgi:hypothetical protein
MKNKKKKRKVDEAISAYMSALGKVGGKRSWEVRSKNIKENVIKKVELKSK